MIHLQKLVDICEYELPKHLQNFTQKNFTEVKIFQNVLGATFLKHPLVTMEDEFLPLSRFISKMTQVKAIVRLLWKGHKQQYQSFRMVPVSMT